MTVTSKIFEPLKVGAVKLSHRVVLAPLTRLRNDDNHVPTDMMVKMYQDRTTLGGLLIAEAIHISKQGTYPRAPEIETQAQIDGWKRVVKAVHDKGGFIFSQIWHSGRATNAIFCPDGSKPLAPSPIAINGLNSAGLQGEMPEEITIDQIKTVYQQFVQRAKNSMAAGFDGVEIHGANGYLIDEFINTSSNKRTDAYGGSIENRCRFVLELVDQVVDAIGEERVAVRFSPWSEYQVYALHNERY